MAANQKTVFVLGSVTRGHVAQDSYLLTDTRPEPGMLVPSFFCGRPKDIFDPPLKPHRVVPVLFGASEGTPGVFSIGPGE